MESDKKKQLKTVIEYFAYAAIVIQTAFAAFWLFKNIGVIKLDYVAHTYILAAESLKVDDSMGILYALLVRGVGHGVLLQELQHVALTAAVFFFSLSLFEKKAGVIIALMVSYNPFILQAAMAVSPNALVLACGLVAIAAGVKAFKDKKWIWVLFCSTIIVGFLNPDYAYIFLIAEVPYVCVMCIRHKKFELLLTVLCLVACAVPVIVNGAIRDDYAYGRVHRSVDYLKMQRIAWPNLHDYVGIMEIYEEQALGERLDTNYKEILTEADKVPENLAMVFANRYENIAGIPAAKRAYEGLTGLTLVKGYGYWTGAVIRDEALYLFSPVAAGYIFLKQVPDTSVSLGLDGLFSESPALFKTYFLFSSAAGVLLVLLYLVRAVTERIAGERFNGTALAITIVLIIVLVSLYATFVCVREYDYRNVLFMVMGWPAAVMALTERRKAL